MDTTPLIDLEPIAKQLKLPLPSVQRTAELLEEGNTVPFVTRFRKDQTGGLDEQQIRAVEKEITRVKLLSERKETILKSIESRDQLTPELAAEIRKARTLRAAEDIYLPFKPKKQSLAAMARARGLEPLALEVIAGAPSSADLTARAAELINAETDLPNVDAVLEGIRHLVAEHFGNNVKLRSQIRKHLWRHGRLVSKRILEPVEQPTDPSDLEANAGEKSTPAEGGESPSGKEPALQAECGSADVTNASVSEQRPPELNNADAATSKPADSAPVIAEQATAEHSSAEHSSADQGTAPHASEAARTAPSPPEPSGVDKPTPAQPEESVEAEAQATPADQPDSTKAAADSVETTPSDDDGQRPTAATESSAEPVKPNTETGAATTSTTEEPLRKVVQTQVKSKKKEVPSRRDQRRETRRRRRERLVQSFKDYFDFSDPIGKVPHHRILAINRGERTKVLRVKVDCADWDKFQSEVEQEFVPSTHQHAEFLRKCWQDAMTRLLLPSLEREIRRELNDKAEEHAVKVFARNLRKLLLQPPLTQHRVVAIDPGFRSGCKLIALDEFGQVLGHTFVNLVGKEPQKQTGREALVAFVKQHGATVIAIGNGAACRESEALVADVLSAELKDQDVAYLIVNEAGTSVYSTSELGREELPDYDATVRGAVSIGRRSLDPLSELVKIDPASIGVGLYQHDVKAKHLRESLDTVVESCVNYVGVDVNSASPALLRYVSGLNALTARRIFEHRQQHGPFRNREQLKDVSGIGELTYVQAAGFLKIADGDNPLDGTWIHPESYPIATRVLEAIGYSVSDLRAGVAAKAAAPVDAGTSSTTLAPTAATNDVVAPDNAVSTVPALAEQEVTEADSSSESACPPAAAQAEQSDREASADGPLTSSATEPLDADQEARAVVAADADPNQTGGAVTDVPVQPAPVSAGESTESEAEESVTAPALSSTAADAQTSELAAASAPVTRPANGLRMKELAERLATIKVSELAPELSVGKLTLEYILTSLARPGRDPREDLPPPIFRRGILKLEDLKPGMELAGTVLNVVDFGAFVDIGLVDSGLIHVSRLADKFVSDPHDVVSVGDILRVWVVEVDQKRRRVSLTAIEPGTEKPRQEKVDRSNAGRPKSRQGAKRKDARGKRPPRGRRQPADQYKPKRAPKPVVPITKEMEEGKEPMRTFGDLKQLFDKRKRPEK